MAKVSLAQEPLDITVRRGAKALAAQRWFLVAIPPRVGLVALQAMVPINEGSGLNCIGMICEWISPRVLFGWNMVPS